MKSQSILKRILSLTLCAALLLGMGPMMQLFSNASATDRTVTAGPGSCGSTHTGTALTNAVLAGKVVTYNGTSHYELENGTYYLSEDLVLLFPLWIAGSTAEVHLDLKGHTISADPAATYSAGNAVYHATTKLSGMVIVSNSAKLDLCDSVGGGGIDGFHLGVSRINGLLGVYNSAVVHMYGGTIYGNRVGNNGGGVHITYLGEFYLHGGAITGNTAKFGGGVAVGSNASKFVMTGGIIANNTAAQGGGIGDYDSTNGNLSQITVRGGTVTGNRALGTETVTEEGTETFAAEGGGIYLFDGTLTLAGGTISDNTAYGTTQTVGITGGGGGICHAAGTFTMTGGTVSGNQAMGTVNTGSIPSGGGGILSKSGTMHITGGIISDNKAAFSGGGIRKQSNTVTVSGGTICNNTAGNGGGIWINGNGSSGLGITVSGGRIYGNTATSSGGGIGSGGNTKIQVSGGTFADNFANYEPNSICVGARGTLTFTGNPVVKDPYTFKTGNAVATIQDLEMGANILANAPQTVVGDTVTETEEGSAEETLYRYTYRESWTDLEQTVVSSLASGAYRLTADTTLTAGLSLSGQVILDLNGKTLTGEAVPYFTIPENASLIILDSSAGQTGKMQGITAENVMILVSGGDLVLESGSLTGHTRTNADHGSVVRVSAGSFTMNGGAIYGNTSQRYGVVYLSGGAFRMNGGEFYGNTAQRGGAIAAGGSNTTVEINGGKIGKEGSPNTAQYGGAIYGLSAMQKLEMNGGEICYNQASSAGAGIYCNGNLTINGGLIANNTAPSYAAIRTADSEFVMTGGIIRDHASAVAIYMARSDADISGASVIDSGKIQLDSGRRLAIHDLKQGAGIYSVRAAAALDGSVKTVSGTAPYRYTWQLNTTAPVSQAEYIFFQDDFEEDLYTAGENAFYTTGKETQWYGDFRYTEGLQRYGIVAESDGNQYLQLWHAETGDETDYYNYFEYQSLSGAYTMRFDFCLENSASGWVLNMLQDYTFPNGKPILAYVDIYGARICDQATDGTNRYTYIKNTNGENFLPQVGTWYSLKMTLEEGRMTLKVWEREAAEPETGAGVAVCAAEVLDTNAVLSQHTIRFRTRIAKNSGEASVCVDNLKLSKEFAAELSQYAYAELGDQLHTVTPSYVGQNLAAEEPYQVQYTCGNSALIQNDAAAQEGNSQLTVSLKDVRGNDTGIFYTTTLIVGDAYGISIGSDIQVEESEIGNTRTLVPAVDASLPVPSGYTIVWESEDPYVVTVNAAGKLTYKAYGDADITARVLDANGRETPYFAKIKVQIGQTPVRILSIGSDISSAVVAKVSSLAKLYGLRYQTDYLELSSATIRNHAHNLANQAAEYSWYTSNAATGELRSRAGEPVTMDAAVQSENWDYIILNQGPIEAGFPGTYNEDLQYLLDYLADVQPNAKIYWNMNWAFVNEESGANGDFSNSSVTHDEDYAKFYNSSAHLMHGAILSTLIDNIAGTDAVFGDDIDGWFPVGLVVKNVRSTVGVFVNNTQDFHNLNENGKLAAAMTVLKTLNPDLNLNTITTSNCGTTITSAHLTKLRDEITAAVALAQTPGAVQKQNTGKTDTSAITQQYTGSVIMGQENLPLLMHFPDTKVTSDGTVWSCAYVNVAHYPNTADRNETRLMYQGVGELVIWSGTQNYTTQQWQASYENPSLVITQEVLERWGCTPKITGRYDLLKRNPYASYIVMADPRDGNFGVVTTDIDGDNVQEEVLLFTFWIRYYDQNGGSGYQSSKLFMTWAVQDENGNWVWEDRCQELKPEAGAAAVKRGDITAFSDGRILIPCYGGSVGVPADAEYATSPAYAMYMEYNTSKGIWEEIYSYDIPNFGQEESTTLNEVSLVVTDSDSNTVYAFTREAGNVLVSYDRGQHWENLANEPGICQQPGFTVLDENRVYVTWAMSPGPRTTYGKVFYVNGDWFDTQTQVVYASPVRTSHDAADPSCALLPNGKVLIISYDTAYQAIVGVFEDPNDAKYQPVEDTGSGE